MRIQEQYRIEKMEFPRRDQLLLSKEMLRPDSIEHLAQPLWVVGKIKQIYRKTIDFFRRILCRFFPLKPYTPVSKNRINYHQIVQEGRTVYRMLVDGVSTENEIIYTKKDGVIFLGVISFPDKALRAHLGLLLGEILRVEEAQAFSTNVIDFAKLLWNCGYTAKGAKVRFYPESTHYHQQQLNTLIDMAKERKEGKTLPGNVHDCLDRITMEVSSQGMIDSFVDLAVSMSLLNPRESSADIELRDIFSLMDAMDIENMRGVTFETAKDGWLKFQESP